MTHAGHDLEEQLTMGLREHAEALHRQPGGFRPAAELLADATAAHRRYRHRRQALVAAGTVAMITAASAVGALAFGRDGAAVVTGSSATPGSPTDTGPAASGSPKLRLIAAVMRTRATSYRITLTSTVTQHLDGRGDEVASARFEGVYDPSLRLGSGTVTHSHSSDGARPFTLRVRIVDGQVYEQPVDAGDRSGWTVSTLPDWSELMTTAGRPLGATEVLSLDPGDLLPALQDLGQPEVEPHSATQKADIYRFTRLVAARTVTVGPDAVDESPDHTIASTVQVDPHGGQVLSFGEETTVTGAHPEIADRDPVTFRTDVEFSDFGTPVDVTAPPADQLRPGGASTDRPAVPSPSPTTR